MPAPLHAAPRFRPGERVMRPTRRRDRKTLPEWEYGVVIGLGRHSPTMVRVLIDGQRDIRAYDQDCWAKLERQ